MLFARAGSPYQTLALPLSTSLGRSLHLLQNKTRWIREMYCRSKSELEAEAEELYRTLKTRRSLPVLFERFRYLTIALHGTYNMDILAFSNPAFRSLETWAVVVSNIG